MAAEKSPEEIRRQMKERFDAVNEAEAKQHKARREVGNAREAEESQRWLKREPDATPADSGASETKSLGD